MAAPALVALAHGSRDPRSAATIKALVDEVRALRPDLRIETAFLDLSKPSLNTVVDKLARAAREALQSEDVLAALHPQGFDALSGGPEVFASIIQSEIKRWGEVAQAAGLKK